MSNALPLSMSNRTVPAVPQSRPRSTWAVAPALCPVTPAIRPAAMVPLGRPACVPTAPPPRIAPPPPRSPIPVTMAERMAAARERIRGAAEAGVRIRSYEVALDLDLSEFHFARQFRAAFGRSPHVFYDEIRAERARLLLREGLADGDVARKVGLRRPAELRALLTKRAERASA